MSSEAGNKVGSNMKEAGNKVGVKQLELGCLLGELKIASPSMPMGSDETAILQHSAHECYREGLEMDNRCMELTCIYAEFTPYNNPTRQGKSKTALKDAADPRKVPRTSTASACAASDVATSSQAAPAVLRFPPGQFVTAFG